MIDIMAIRESYERREITEIRWINGKDNPGDTFTKNWRNEALRQLLETNRLTVRAEGWVERTEKKEIFVVKTVDTMTVESLR